MSLSPPSKEQLAVIFEEINETTSNKLEENVQTIKQWLECQPHLPYNYDERILASMIRGCKHQLERVKSKLDCYYTTKTVTPELFRQTDVTLPEMNIIKHIFVIAPLPILSPDGCRITYHSIKKDLPKIDIKNAIKLMLMIGDIRLIEEGPISGDIFIFDMSEVTSACVPTLLNPYVKKGLSFAQNALPQRLKQVHIINCPSYAESIINFAKMFLKPKIRDRFQAHSSVESLFHHIPRECFPSDLGGNAKKLDIILDEWWTKLENYTTYFEKQESVHSDESKRRQNDDAYGDAYGTIGSFHKLDID